MSTKGNYEGSPELKKALSDKDIKPAPPVDKAALAASIKDKENKIANNQTVRK